MHQYANGPSMCYHQTDWQKWIMGASLILMSTLTKINIYIYFMCIHTVHTQANAYLSSLSSSSSCMWVREGEKMTDMVYTWKMNNEIKSQALGSTRVHYDGVFWGNLYKQGKFSLSLSLSLSPHHPQGHQHQCWL